MADFLVNHGYLIFLVTCSAGFLAGGIFPARTLLKQIGFNLAALFFALALFEGYLWMTAGEKEKNTTTSGSFAAKGTFIDSPDLGYVIGKDGLYTARKTTADGGAVYDARYTIHDGIRATPNSTDTAGRSAFFFGCSVTFGTGVNDDQTLPFYFNEAAGGHYRVYNFGLPGYGPHQMLALVESSRFEEIPAGREGKDIAVYSFIPDHIRRSAGYSSWDRSGPRYEIRNGNLVRAGNFDHPLPGSEILPVKIWHASRTWKKLFSPESKRAATGDFIRAEEIIKKANQLLQARGMRLFVLTWDQRKNPDHFTPQQLADFYRALEKAHIPVIHVSSIMSPDVYEKDTDRYAIKNDGHPTPFFHRTVAGHLFRQIDRER